MSNFFKNISVQFLLVLGLAFTLAACGGGKEDPPTASSNPSVAVNTAPYTGDQCSNGGITVESGIDDNGNGVLDPSEVDNTQIVCNGEDGVNTLVSTTDEPAGNNCAYGGVKIETGLDNNGDGALSADEIDSTSYACGGADGQNGNDGNDGEDGTDGVNGVNSLVSISDESAGENCENGGEKVEVGRDLDNNGVLDPEEIDNFWYVCNGEDGQDGNDGSDGNDGADGNDGLTSLISISDESAGDNCNFGGVKIESGLDGNSDGVLDPDEVDDTQYVCNGSGDGLNSLVVVSEEPQGDNCANGGVRIEVGLDDNRNGILDIPDEVDDTAYVCNGSGGSGGGGPYSVGGTVSGLSGTLTLQNNGGDDLDISADGAFSFLTLLNSGEPYDVTVVTNPANQTCTLVYGSGAIPGANVTGVMVFCSSITYSVGGTVGGLTGTVILQNNGGDDLTITANEPFRFATELANLSPYNVSVSDHPTAQTCDIGDGVGSISGANVTNVTVYCVEDIDAPTVDFTSPADGDLDVELDINVAATFSEAMDASGITTSTFTLYDNTESASVSGVVEYDGGSDSAIFNPSELLVIGHDYTATITTGATDLASNPLSADYLWSFATIADGVPPVNATGADFIDSGALRTGTTSVMIAIAATDDFGVTDYYVAENDTGVAPADPAYDASGWMAIDSASSFNSTVPYEISGSYPDETDVYLYVWFKDSAGNVSPSASDGINLLAAIFSYDFEEGINGWSADGGLWDVGTPTAGPSVCYSGTQCAGTVLDGNYGEYTDSRLITPTIVLPDVTGNEELHMRFRHWFSLHEFEIEYVQVQAYDEATATWSDWQTEDTVVSVPNGEKYELTVSYAWSLKDLDLTSYAGQRIRIAFYHTATRASCCSSESTGWYIDDVSLNLIPLTTIPSGSTLQDNFEEGIGNWGSDGGLWEVGTPTAGPTECYSGTQCAGTVLNGNYSGYTDSRLITPTIVLPDVTGNEELYLRFRHWFSLYEYEAEYIQVQAYDEATATWSDWQTEDTVVPSIPNGDNSISPAWSLSNTDLTSYAGQRVRIAFYHTATRASCCSSNSTGWYIDDVSIEVVTF